MAATASFMDSPLVVWIQTFNGPVSFKELCDGVYVNSVMHQIDPRASTDIQENVEDVKDRIHNWDVLLKNIKAYYQDILQQFIVMRLPNIMAISRESETERGQREIEKVLLLLLGCTVQCEEKESFIDNIKELDINVQHAIVEHIQEITDEGRNVFAVEVPEEQLDEVSRSMYAHLRTLISERDGYIEEIKDLTQNLEELCQQQQQSEVSRITAPISHPSPNVTPDKHHVGVELAECKAKMRKLRQELEEKSEQCAEVQDELEETKDMLAKLRNENMDLIQDARAARTYRDELDILKEKATRVDKYEGEITKYKEKLNELDFYKARVEELREDNAILMETKNMLEDQIEASQKRVESVVEVENELIKCRQTVDEMCRERDTDRRKLQELSEENARLEFEKKSSFNESATLEEELMRARSELPGLSNSLSDQLNETSNTKILRLELENQRLHKQVEEIKQNALLESSSKDAELEKDNTRLVRKIEALQAANSAESAAFLEVEQANQELVRQKESLQETVEKVKDNSERQIKELESENEQLTATLQKLRERNEKTVDNRLKETEKENKRMHDEVQETTTQLSRLEYENRQLQKSHARLQETVKKLREVEEENHKLEKEISEQRRTIATMKHTCDKFDALEQESSQLEVENHKLSKEVELLKKSVVKMETLEQDNIDLNVQTESLKRTIEHIKNSSSKVVDLEQEKVDMGQRIQQLQKTIDSYKAEKSKHEQMESNLLELDTENQKLQRGALGLKRKLEQRDKEVHELENQLHSLQRSKDEMQLALRKMNDIEKEFSELESENQTVLREKSSVEKENKRIKQSLETKDAALDEASTKISSLEKECKRMRRALDKAKDATLRAKDFERDNTELQQQVSMDKKTLSTLREDLVQEKISTQQLSNELEKLTQELEKVGLNREKLVAAEHAHDESKFQALESLMEDAFRQSMQIKEDKIQALESRLEESKKRNLQLQSEMRAIKHDYEAYQQRREEEVLVHSADRVSSARSQPNATKGILELKDHLITLERANATLEAENRNLTAQSSGFQDRLRSLEHKNNKLQTHISSNQGQNNQLQSQFAKLQVENKTLQSENATLASQISALQKQHSQLEHDHEHVLSTHEELQGTHSGLVSDHDALQRLHDQLSTEYEALISEHGSLKANYKALKAELKELQDQHSELRREKDTIAEIKASIEQDKVSLRNESKSLSTLQLDYIHVKEENIRLRSSNEKLTKEYRGLLDDHKAVKNEYNQLKLKHTELQGTFAECRDQLNNMDVDISKMASRCEINNKLSEFLEDENVTLNVSLKALTQLNTKLEEENRTLMMQLQALLNQNQEMLTQSLESKDHFHEEERAYMEKLAELKRQKEKLEEKIMEQYKRYDPIKKKNRSFGANLVRKARSMLGGNRSRERERTTSTRDSPDNSSLGSTETKNRRSSSGDLLDGGGSNKLRKQNKLLAKSTTALNMLKEDEIKRKSSFNLRGARSTDDLLETSEAPKRDSDSVSSNSSSHKHHEWPSRPLRKRQLLDSGLNGSNGRQGSVSSDDPSHSHESSMEMASSTRNTLRPRSPTINLDKDSEEMISLMQFLEESDRSPKSRRKLLISKSIDPDTLHEESQDTTTQLHSSTALTPKSPILEKEDDEPITDFSKKDAGSRNGRGMTPSKSEGNVARLARESQDSGPLRFSDLSSDYASMHHIGPESTKSTPLTAPPPYNHERFRDRHRGGSSGSEGSHSQSSGGQYNHYQRGDSQGRVSPPPYGKQLNASHNTYNERNHFTQGNNQSYPGRAGGGGGLHHQNGNSMSRQSSDSSVTSDPIYSTIPRKVSSTTNNNNLPSRKPPFALNDDYVNAVPRHTNSANFHSTSTSEPPGSLPKSASADQLGDSSPRNRKYPAPRAPPPGHFQEDRAQNSDSEMASQYTPGNVRHLVQNYQKSVQQTRPQTPGVGVGPASQGPPPSSREGPVPPPRRSRPVSAGPVRSNLSISVNVNHSARAQSVTPDYVPSDNIRPGSGRQLPARPDERKTQPARPGSTPPRPNGTPEDKKNPNSVWYEYGCV